MQRQASTPRPLHALDGHEADGRNIEAHVMVVARRLQQRPPRAVERACPLDHGIRALE